LNKWEEAIKKLKKEKFLREVLAKVVHGKRQKRRSEESELISERAVACKKPILCLSYIPTHSAVKIIAIGYVLDVHFRLACYFLLMALSR